MTRQVETRTIAPRWAGHPLLNAGTTQWNNHRDRVKQWPALAENLRDELNKMPDGGKYAERLLDVLISEVRASEAAALACVSLMDHAIRKHLGAEDA